MRTRDVASRVVTVVLIVVIGAMLAGQVLGQPVLLSYVETGSMEPQLQPGDGFVAIPMAVSGPIEPGDVIVFEAERLHGGGLVTHRVVGETDQGFITKGDANPVNDQESSNDEPPVQREQIVATALQIGDRIVVIPQIGTAVIVTGETMSGLQTQLAGLLGTRMLLGTQGIAYLLLAIGVGAYLISALLERESGPTRERKVRRDTGTLNATMVIVGLTLVLIVVTTASMTVASGPQRFGVISSDTDAPGARVIPKGQSETVDYQVPSNGLVPVVVFLEPGSGGIDVSPRELYVGGNQVANATVTLTAPPETGYYRMYLNEHRYLAVLPQSTIRTLYGVHPWLPIVAIDILLGVGFAAIGGALVGFGQVRSRSRDIDMTWSTRIRRWLR